MSKREDYKKADGPRFNMQYIAGMSALALVCFCLLCILFLAVPAHASSGSAYSAAQTPRDITPTDTSTSSPTVTATSSPTVTDTPSPTDTTTPSPTVTNTPSPTVTNTPSPTATSTQPPSPTPTTTPAPSPDATRTVFPSPTTSATVGATASPTVAISPGASPTGVIPTGTQGTGTNQGPADSPTPANNSGNSSNTDAGLLARILPFILTILGLSVLFGLLFLPVRAFLRKRLIPLPSPNLPPSGAAPWSRAPINAGGQSGQPAPFAQPGNGPFNTPTGAPFPGGFNAAPTQANVPANTWNNAMPASSYPQSPPALAPAPAFPGYTNQAQPLQPFPAPPVIPATNGYVGLTQNQQPFPTTPPLLPGVQAADASNQQDPAVHPMSPDEPTWDADPRGDAFNNGTRKRLRRNGLRPSGEDKAPGEQISGEHSADRMVVSDPYLQALLRQSSQQGQIVKQAPEESS